MKKTGIIITMMLLGMILTGCGSIELLKEEEITIELGETVSTDPADYVNATSDSILKQTEVKTYRLDNMTAGEYPIYITYRDTSYEVRVTVVDTVAPEVTLENDGDVGGMAGIPISSEEIIAEAYDLAGIESISFAENETDPPATEEEVELSVTEVPLPTAWLLYEENGVYENEIIVTDRSGNETRMPIQVSVGGDLDEHVTGIEDLTVVQGTSPDWLEHVEYDSSIQSVEVDDSAVDMDTPGEYELIYIITASDNETTLEVKVKVTVVEAEEEEEELTEDLEEEQSDNDSSGRSSNSSTGSSTGSSSGSGSSSGGSGGTGGGNNGSGGGGNNSTGGSGNNSAGGSGNNSTGGSGNNNTGGGGNNNTGGGGNNNTGGGSDSDDNSGSGSGDDDGGAGEIPDSEE